MKEVIVDKKEVLKGRVILFETNKFSGNVG